jgi:SOS response regulatory protein OraA/RecX
MGGEEQDNALGAEGVLRVCRFSNPSRAGAVAVYARVEGGRQQKVATLDAEGISKLGIVVGTEWTARLASRAEALGLRNACLRDALRMAGGRLMSRRRVVDRLCRRGHDATLAGEVAEMLARSGVVDDEQLARIVASATASAKRGKRAIESKLRTRGIDAKTAKAAAATAAGERDALQDATDLASARLARLPGKLDANGKRRRLVSLLLRRGHDFEIAERVVRGLLKGE